MVFVLNNGGEEHLSIINQKKFAISFKCHASSCHYQYFDTQNLFAYTGNIVDMVLGCSECHFVTFKYPSDDVRIILFLYLYTIESRI